MIKLFRANPFATKGRGVGGGRFAFTEALDVNQHAPH